MSDGKLLEKGPSFTSSTTANLSIRSSMDSMDSFRDSASFPVKIVQEIHHRYFYWEKYVKKKQNPENKIV